MFYTPSGRSTRRGVNVFGHRIHYRYSYSTTETIAGNIEKTRRLRRNKKATFQSRFPSQKRLECAEKVQRRQTWQRTPHTKRATENSVARVNCKLVRIKGLEPPRLSASDPKSDVATNYTISANVHFETTHNPSVRCDSLRTLTKVEKIRERGRQTRIF